MAERGCHPSQCVVLVPYAQLMATARQAWAELAALEAGATLFVPQVQTTQNWASAIWAARGGFQGGPDDLRLDAAFDLITAGHWLVRAGIGGKDALSPRLMEAAWTLARAAAAVPPEQRAAWGEAMRTELTAGWTSPVLQMEATVAQLALAWASSSRYATDVLFEAQPGLLVVLEGFQRDPLADALRHRRGEGALSLALAAPARPRGRIVLQRAADAQDEAERAAACVMDLLMRQVRPVGLIAQDRVLVRRVRALLAEQRVAVRDETGWTLSTSRAAAVLMSLLRALPREASCDAVLDWLKHARSMDAQELQAVEAELRHQGVRRWAGIGPRQVRAHRLAEQVRPWLEGLRSARPLKLWLAELRQVLRKAGQWDAMVRDVAGQAVMDALRLHEDGEQEFRQFDARLHRREFTQWVSHTLESATFSPVHPPEAQVVILPLSQLLGRSLAAMVLPGADELNLPASPEPPGPWTAAQRLLLGLPTREELMAASRASWNHALQLPELHLLWRQSEGGEPVMPAPWVQELKLGGVIERSVDLRPRRTVQALPTRLPAPSGAQLPVERLSHSAYADLRSCPYRFFALRQLGLQEAQELESELDKRDFGNWLHETLDRFHRGLQAAPSGDIDVRGRMLDAAAEQARLALDLQPAEFLPFQVAWPQVRSGYLAWLAQHEAAGLGFAEAEVWKERALGPWLLHGKIDRMDRDAQGRALLLDYKTESPEKTRARLKQGAEDTQLAFYAALLDEAELGAAYVNVGEKGETATHAQPEVLALRELLLQGITEDLTRLHAGQPLPALGQGLACEHCQARGLCRKDFVVQEARP